ncbi:MAG: hypothetical protein GX270_07335 [Clostridiaceae bacterium]|nr:hypothetical protein [Clostridiaceae bacterium]
MNRSKRIIAFIISCTFFAQILTTNVLGDTNFKLFEETQNLETQGDGLDLASDAVNVDGKMEGSVLDSVYAPIDISDELLDELPLEEVIPTDIKMLAEIPEGKLPIGDVDGNGTVDSLDFAYMRIHLLGVINDFKPEDDLWVSDVSGDDVFDSIDFAFMRLFLLGKISEFPKQKLITSPTPISIDTPTPTASETAVIVETPTPKPTEIVVETPTPLVSDVPSTETPSPTPTTEPVVVEGQLRVEVKQFNEDSSGVISPNFKIYNIGDSSIDLSKVKVRYYYTIDGESAQQFICDYSNVDADNVVGNFVKMQKINTTTNYYIEVSFTSTAGYISPNDCVEIQVRVYKTNWTNYDLTNDYSRSISTDYGECDLVTAYIDEVLQWGIEPIVYEPTPMPTPTPTIRPTEGPDKDIYTPYYNLAKEPLLENALTYGYINSDEDADYFVFTPSHTGLYRFEGVDGIKDSIGFITAFNPNDNILYNYSTYPSNGSSPWYVESYLYAGTKNYFHMSKYDKGEGNIPCLYSIKVTYLKPDLSIYSTEPNSDCVGNSTTYTVEVVNNGGDMIEGQSFVVTLLVEGTDIVLSTECSTLLAKNKTVTIEFPKQAGFDLSTLTKGQYIINVKVDDQNTIDESNETNNSVSKYFFIEDYGNTKESATEIKLGAKVSGKMDYSSDYDYFKFIPESDANYVMLSSDENIKFDLYDGNGKGLKYGYSLVPYKLIAGNTYYIRLYNKSGLITDYEFVLEKEDYGNEINFATPIKVEDKIIGKIDYKNDWDYFQYTPDSNGAYAIISSNENMRIDFFDSNGKRLKYGHSPVPYEMIAGNTYYIGLGSKDGLITDYEFVLEKEDYGNEINFATPIKVEDKIIGKIDYKYDGDYFKFVPDSNELILGQ